MDWPLVGRDALIRRLWIDLQRGRSLVIVGDEGVGKTKLAAKLGDLAQQHGDAAQRIVGSPSASQIPFAAVSHLLPSQLPTDDAEMMAGLLKALQARAADRGALRLIVDDAHLLDEHSAVFVHQVAVQGVASLLLTALAGESLPPALVGLWKDGIAERVEIGPLSRPSATLLVEKVLGGSIDQLTMGELWQRTQGNPLYLRELVLAGVETGTLTNDGAMWHASGTLPASIRVSELVTARLGRLTSGEQRVLDLIAVADGLDLDLLRALAEENAIDRLEERRVIVIDRDLDQQLVRPAHPIYAEAVADMLPRARRRRIELDLAAALSARPIQKPDDVLRVALWRLDAGADAPRATLVAAGNRALAVFDAPLAERLARAAIRDDKHAPEADGQLLLGRALAAQHRVEEADEALRQAAAEAGTDAQIATAALARANLLYFRAARIAEASQVLEDALGKVHDRDWRGEIESLLVLFRAAAGQLRAVAAAGRRMVELRGARPRAIVHTLLYSSVANAMLGRFAEAQRQVQLGLELAPTVREELPFAADMIGINGVIAGSYSGHHQLAVEHARHGQQLAIDSGATDMAGMWQLELAESQMLAGDIASALQSVLAALAILRRRDPFASRGIGLAVASTLATWLGRHGLAAGLRTEIIENDLLHDVRSRIWFDRASIWQAWVENDADTAGAMAIEAGRRAAVDTHLVWATWLYHDAARLGVADPAAERLEALSPKIEGDLIVAMTEHARALADKDAVGLERAASRFERLGSLLFAAEAAAQAQQAYLAQGRMRLSRVAGTRATMLAIRCPGVRTPALIQMSPVSLTPREVEIARLAADGMSSRELADRLGISVRTVDNHLGTIYAKVGVSGRGELPNMFGAIPIDDPFE